MAKFTKYIFIILLLIISSCDYEPSEKEQNITFGNFSIYSKNNVERDLFVSGFDTTVIIKVDTLEQSILSYDNKSIKLKYPNILKDTGLNVNFKTLNKRIYLPRYSRVIEQHITDFIYNENYLLIDQQPIDSLLKKYTIRSFKDVKIALDSDTFHQYYIIIKARNKIYGPLNLQEYIIKKTELGIPKILKLKTENNK